MTSRYLSNYLATQSTVPIKVGAQPKGSRGKYAAVKITDADVIEMRQKFQHEKHSVDALWLAYPNVAKTTISKIVHYQVRLSPKLDVK
jgi:type VI protein secretion system component Hcp